MAIISAGARQFVHPEVFEHNTAKRRSWQRAMNGRQKRARSLSPAAGSVANHWSAAFDIGRRFARALENRRPYTSPNGAS